MVFEHGTPGRVQNLRHEVRSCSFHLGAGGGVPVVPGLEDSSARSPAARQLRGLDPDTVTAGQMTYDLRRLKSHGLIDKIPHTHRYQVTDQCLSDSMFCPQSMTDCYPPAWPPCTPRYQHQSAPPPATTDRPSRTSPTQQVSQHDRTTMMRTSKT